MGHPCRLKIDVARTRLARLSSTQTSIARDCGFELRTVQRWFAGGSVALADAEQLAAALRIGTEDLFDGVPQEGGTAFARIREAPRFLRRIDGSLAQALRSMLDHFEFIDRHVSLSIHPSRGFVTRIPMQLDERRRFQVLHVSPPPDDRDASYRIRFMTQVGRRFRYEFGDIAVAAGEVRLTEHFHTRTARAPLDGRGSFSVWAWTPRELAELVLVADRDVDVERERGRGSDLFDLSLAAAEHAVCFRPAPMHLRDAGYPATFDRVGGPREGRIDVPS
jgi:hypothetical protein